MVDFKIRFRMYEWRKIYSVLDHRNKFDKKLKRNLMKLRMEFGGLRQTVAQN